jgi:hypothetical protein
MQQSSKALRGGAYSCAQCIKCRSPSQCRAHLAFRAPDSRHRIQHVQALCAEVPAAAAMFKRASEILGYDLLDVCVNGPKDKLDSTAVSLLFFRFSLTTRG